MTILDDNTIVVTSADELTTAITGSNNYTYIYFGADITLTSGIGIPLSKNGIVIDGTYEGITYTYTDPNSAVATGCFYFNAYNSTVPEMNITIQNMNVILRNYYGVVAVHESAYAANTTLTYKNLTIEGSQPLFNPFGTTNFIDCVMNIGSASLNGEIGEAHIVNISGNTKINHSYTAYHGFSLRGGNNQGVHILENSNVEITCGRNLLYFAGNGDFTVGKNATLNVTCPYGFAYSNTNGAQNILFDTDSNIKCIRTSATGGATLVFDQTLTINQRANLYIETTVTNSNPQIYTDVTGATMNINDPASIILVNNATNLFYFTGTTNLNINTRHINNWTTVPPAGDINNIPTYHWQKDNSNIIKLIGTATNTTTSITSTNFTDEEITTLPNIALLQLRTSRTLSMGYLPILNINAIADGAINISGTVGNDYEVKVITPNETLYTAGDSNTGNFIFNLGNPLTEGDNISLTTSDSNYLYNIKTVTVIYPGDLTLDNVPNTLLFVLTPISTNPLLFPRSDDFKIIVTDSRIESSNWKLYASIDNNLTSDNEYVLTDSLVNVNSNSTIDILSDEPIIVYTGEDNQGITKITEIGWPQNEGILLRLENEPLYNSEIYKANITWYLEE